LKIIAGPQAGAEIALETGKAYIIGNDASASDIVFYDLSVSKQHAQVIAGDDGICTIEDLQSRNGTVVDGRVIEGKVNLGPQQVASAGTTSFVIIDREKASETIFAVAPQVEGRAREEALLAETAAAKTQQTAEQLKLAALEAEKAAAHQKAQAAEKSLLTSGGLILTFTILGILALIGVGTWKLFSSKEAYVEQKDYTAIIDNALKAFPAVSYTYNKTTGALFLVGHVMNLVEKNQLNYNLKGLSFIANIDDTNVVVDQLVWQEMNNLIAKNPTWNGINMYAVAPGHFVLTGYLKTSQEGGLLTDYINRNFPFLDKLENKVVVEQDLNAKVQGDLFSQGLNGVKANIINGDLTLTGFIPSNRSAAFQKLISDWKLTPGIRTIKNFVAFLAPEDAVVDISDRYKVTGYAKSDAVNVNVMINGRIFTRGDNLDGMTITSIQPDTIYLEKGGLKFKINYNP
jgi:type III secretion system YscD/HrpQ family protein